MCIRDRIASETSDIYQKYIQPVANCDALPFIVFDQKNSWHNEVNQLVKNVYGLMSEQGQCYEMAVQRELSSIFQCIFSNFDELPKTENTRIQINTQIRIQKMLSYIREHYAEAVTLEEIARSANISRSEAGRCFNAYVGCSPVDALIQHRLQVAHLSLIHIFLDVREYIQKKEEMLVDYEDQTAWAKKALVNIAKAGYFSADRTIAEYNRDIWKLS